VDDLVGEIITAISFPTHPRDVNSKRRMRLRKNGCEKFVERLGLSLITGKGLYSEILKGCHPVYNHYGSVNR
jgi:hypothetical protein